MCKFVQVKVRLSSSIIILVAFSIINHPATGDPHYRKPPFIIIYHQVSTGFTIFTILQGTRPSLLCALLELAVASWPNVRGLKVTNSPQFKALNLGIFCASLKLSLSTFILDTGHDILKSQVSSEGMLNSSDAS